MLLASFVDSYRGPSTRSLEVVLWLPVEKEGRALERRGEWAVTARKRSWGWGGGNAGRVWESANLVLSSEVTRAAQA